MLSISLLAGILVCLLLPPLNVWAPLLLLLLFLTNALAFWTAIGLTGVGAFIYYWRTRP